MENKEYKCHLAVVGVHIGVGTEEHDLTGDECRDLLNELSTENRQLKLQNKKYSMMVNANHDLNDEIYGQLTKIEKEYKSILAENEELKEIIEDISGMDKETDIEMQHINNIYKKHGFKGVIEYAKDKLQTFGAVREVDEGLWLFATGGWSDNEHWLHSLKEWSFIYGRGHYCATTTGGGYYYSEEPYARITIRLKREENDRY